MLLVIGYGNELRRDDGVGPRAARTVAGWGAVGVRALAVHQLTPELADEVGRAGTVIFVDAAAEGGPANAVLRTVQPTADSPLGHVSSPQALLALTQALTGRCPRAWLLTIPGVDFGYGEGFSPQAKIGLAWALRILRCWVLREANGA